MMSDLQFLNPLWFLAVVPAILAFWLWRRRRRAHTVLFSSTAALKHAPRTFSQRLRPLLLGSRVLVLALLIVTLARPRQGLAEFRIRTEGISILMCVDRSESMKALDFTEGSEPVDRLTVVKQAFQDFVAGNDELDGRRDDLVGLLAFTGYPESLCPLTLDHGTLIQIVEQLDFPEEYLDERDRPLDETLDRLQKSTAIGNAIARGVDRLKDVDSKSKVMILLSDGESNSDVIDPLQAAELAAQNGIKIYTVGVGSTGSVPFPAVDRFGRRVLRQVHVSLDERLLGEIAELTGGRYFNVRDSDSLAEMYATIDELEKTERESFLYTEYRELYSLCLIPGVLLLVLESLFRISRLTAFP